MKFHFTLTEQNQVEWFLYYIAHSPSLRKSAWRWRLVFPLVSIATAAGLTVFAEASFFLLAYVSLLAVLWFAFYPAVYRYGSARRFKILLAESGNRNCSGAFTMELLDESFRTSGNGIASDFPYSSLKSIVENEGCLYIDVGANSPLLVPFNAFSDEGERRRFLKVLAEKKAVFCPEGPALDISALEI